MGGEIPPLLKNSGSPFFNPKTTTMKNFIKNIFNRYQIVNEIELKTRIKVIHTLDNWKNTITIKTKKL